VLANRFRYVLEHVCQRLLACAFSPPLRDFYDFAATLTGPPELGYPVPAVSKTFVAFTGTMTESVRNTIEEYGPERLAPGDVIIANDPYRTGTHVNDVLFCRPVFHAGRIVAFVTIKAHQLDIGGSVPGGFSATKTSVYENGLVLSPRALFRGGAEVVETFELFRDKVRFAALIERDMRTLCACLELGEELLQASIRQGAAVLLGAMRYACDADAERMTAALERLPDGVWRCAALVDWDGPTTAAVPGACDHPQARRAHRGRPGVARRQARTSINGTFLDAKTVVGVALKFMLDPDGPFTSGLYRPVDILVPEGAICSALPPEGVVFAYGESTNALLLAMFAAMADALGEGAIAGDHGAPNIHTAHGRRADGSPWIAVGVNGGERGPWGATRAGDADSFSIFYQANASTRRSRSPGRRAGGDPRRSTSPIMPALARTARRRRAEDCCSSSRRHAVIVLRPEPTGRGVRGVRTGRRVGVARWRRAGGVRAALAWRVSRCDACCRAPDPVSDAPDARGSTTGWPRAQLADAGRRGVPLRHQWWRRLGDLFARDPERVRRDVRDGYVSIAGARADYGVVIEGDPEADPEGLRIDAADTTRLRAARKR
jgi:N-methylhydantoinase B